MTKIKTYTIKTPVGAGDKWIGTNGITGETKNFSAEGIRDFVLAGLDPETGGTLKITEVEYVGVLTSPSSVANAQDPAYQVAQYEVVIFNVNGNKYFLKLQDFTFGVGQDDIADSDFINIISLKKLGDGTAILKGYNTSSGDWEFYALKSTGNTISIVEGNVVFDPKEGTKLGSTGQNVYKGINATTKLHEFHNIDSDDFTVVIEDNLLKINNVVTADTPKFYVNSGYDVGGSAPQTGSIAKPFKTIASVLTAYIGTGSAQEPQYKNADIIIQKGVGYTFTGSFAINTGSGSIILEEGTSVISNPASGDWLCNYDSLSDTEIASLNIVLKDNALLTLKKSGFKNRGTSVNNSLFTDVKNITISMTSQAIIYCDVNDPVTTSYTIIESNYVSTDTFKNDSSETISVLGGTLFSLTQKIDKIGGNSNIVYDGVLLKSGTPTTTVNSGLVAFDRIGGKVRSSNCIYNTQNANTRAKLFSLTKNSSIPCEMYSTNDVVYGNITTLFQNESSNQALLRVNNMSTLFFTCTYIAKSPNATWTSCGLFYCNFSDGEVDFSQVDLTSSNAQSAYNIFDNNIVETLRVFGSRALAVAGGLKKGSKFINRKTVNAGSFVVGVEYQILTVGTTNFTLIGASANTVGVNFIASGVGTGDGTAYQHTIDVLI